ncbi:MAG TPA: recombinase family protein [Oligoflexus sp.]|uniref:recombinase family protein n=1 Tax=Oligoflexus sp. TaxID=1971216 RepID=UPI002D61DCF1|nr:recombinase family protein [Oligoflexus sp.]HYX31877.1 recombinase family protein [Oligoflexus sp.]
MAFYIYSRVSTDGQSTDAQVMALTRKYPHADVVTETRSGAKSRPFLTALLEQLMAGDTLIVAALDRLGRRTTEILALIEDLQRRNVNLISEREGVDYGSPTGRLVTQILVSVAEMERNLIAERTRAGLAAAREKGRLIGRRRSISEDIIHRAVHLVSEGTSIRKAARAAGISHTHLANILKFNASEGKSQERVKRRELQPMANLHVLPSYSKDDATT